jgi:ERCC4-type nuclease
MSFVILQDSREVTPLRWPEGQQVEIAGLQTGDYSCKNFERHIALERKSLPDLLMCMGSERIRFCNELMRLKAFPLRAVLVEGSFNDIVLGNYRSKITSAAAVGSLSSWYMKYKVGFFFCGTPEAASVLALSMMSNYIRNLKELVNNLECIENV